MILFKEDWAKYPGAIADMETKNTSFLQYASLLRSMGVENWAWPLQLFDRGLQGVDPHDPNLDRMTRERIQQECHYNPVYAIRECLRIPEAAGAGTVYFRANRGNMGATWLFLCWVDFIYIQIRQTGKTTWLYAMTTVLLYMVLVGSKILLVTKDDQLRRENVEGIKRIRDYLPPYLNSHRKGKDPDNQHEIVVGVLDNKLITGVSRNSETGANKLGRGNTTAIRFYDEAPFGENMDITIPAANSSGDAARKDAIRNNLPNCSVITTTAGEKDTKSGKFIYNELMNSAVWTETFMDCRNRTDLHRIIKKNSRNSQVSVNLTMGHRQLGLTDEWLFGAIKRSRAGHDPDKVNRDYFNVWTSGNLRSPIPGDIRKKIQESRREPTHTEIGIGGYAIRWYVPIEKIGTIMRQSRFVLGLDTSDAVGSDDIGFSCIDAYSGKLIFAANCNEANLVIFAKFVAEILIKYPTVTLNFEHRSSGKTFLDTLFIELPKHNINPFERIYNQIYSDPTKHEKELEYLNSVGFQKDYGFYKRYAGYFGLRTSAASRETLYGNVMAMATRRLGSVIYDATIIDQLNSLVVKNGRIDHKTSGHDDIAFSWLLTHWFLMETQNLAAYGIDSSMVYANAPKDNTTSVKRKKIDDYRSALNERYLKEAKEILEKLKSEKDSINVMRLTARLRFLNGVVEGGIEKGESIDALINNARTEADNDRKIRRAEGSQNRETFRDSLYARFVASNGPVMAAA